MHADDIYSTLKHHYVMQVMVTMHTNTLQLIIVMQYYMDCFT